MKVLTANLMSCSQTTPPVPEVTLRGLPGARLVFVVVIGTRTTAVDFCVLRLSLLCGHLAFRHETFGKDDRELGAMLNAHLKILCYMSGIHIYHQPTCWRGFCCGIVDHIDAVAAWEYALSVFMHRLTCDDNSVE